MLSPPADRPDSISPVDRFRAPAKRLALHPTEKALLVVAALHLVFVSWALGGMYSWSQAVGLGFGMIELGLALMTRHYGGNNTPDGQHFRLVMWPKLLRFPVFWFGLAFLAYIVVQALNPAWQFVQNARGAWWMQRIDCISWLPHGTTGTPFRMMSPGRSLLIYGAPFLLVCSLWVGFTRRRSVTTLLTVLAVNGALLALLGFLQRMQGADKIFWVWQPPAPYFVASFIYKNHAGAYFNLMVAVCATLATWHFARPERHSLKSTPGGVFAFLCTTTAIAVIISYSRAAVIVLLMYVVGLALAIVVRRFFQPAADRHLAVTGALACGLIAFVGVGLYWLEASVAWDRMNDLLDRDRVSSITARETAAHATFEMARDELWLGHGSGSFRFIFPRYQQPYPSLGVEAGVIRSFWEHAHNDYAEALAEWGLVGVLPLFAILVFWLARAIRLECWRHPALLVLLAGLAMPMLHSWVDFNAHNPAVLTTWCALWPCLVRWLEIEERA